ncbi:hypothetical protein ABI59_14305 [Acidobacteria bacterium Mor1]|nr:hypothetical protein ABI59_14305 [Acidobacteria bacterium Mor1]
MRLSVLLAMIVLLAFSPATPCAPRHPEATMGPNPGEGAAHDAPPVRIRSAATDADQDGVPDDIDNCPDTFNAAQRDVDVDSIGDLCDNCPYVSNGGQIDPTETAPATCVTATRTTLRCGNRGLSRTCSPNVSASRHI